MKSMIAFFAIACLLAIASAQVLLSPGLHSPLVSTWAAPGYAHVAPVGYASSWVTAENTILPATSILYKK